MSDLIDTTEMYLKTVLELEEDGVVPMRARIAERLGQSGPTVSQTVARMERDGLLELAQDRHLVLTELGRREAVRVMRKHRLAERLLLDVIGLDVAVVHEEACRWEHVMSEEVERRIIGLVQDATRSPYGNPVPGLEELGVKAAPAAEGMPSSQLATDAEGARSRARLTRLGEPAQVDPEVLGLLLDSGIRPGAEVVVWADGDRTIVEAEEAVSLPADVAAHVFCTPLA